VGLTLNFGKRRGQLWEFFFVLFELRYCTSLFKTKFCDGNIEIYNFSFYLTVNVLNFQYKDHLVCAL